VLAMDELYDNNENSLEQAPVLSSPNVHEYRRRLVPIMWPESKVPRLFDCGTLRFQSGLLTQTLI